MIYKSDKDRYVSVGLLTNKKQEERYEKRKLVSILTCAAIGVSTLLGTTANTFASEKEPVEIIAKRTEYSKTYDNGNGTYTSYVNTAPIHYASNGEWIEIDNSLVIDNNGDYRTKNNAMNVELASSSSVNDMSCVNDSDNQMLEISNGKYSFSWSMIDLNTNISSTRIATENSVSLLNVESDDELSVATRSNDELSTDTSELVENLETSATYYSIYPNIDLKIDISPNYVKDTIIINSKNAIKDEFTYYIEADGLDARVNEDNSIDFISETNETIFFISPSFMFDSSENAELNYDIDVNITEFKNGYLLTIMPDTEWLNSNDRVFPIMIDPTTGMGGDPIKHSTYVYEGSPDSTYSDSYIKVGGSTANGTRNEAFIFPQQMYLGFNDTIEILDAECIIYVLVAPNAPLINVDLLTSPTSTLSWNGTRSIGYECCTEFDISDNNFAGEYSIDITALFQMWLNYYKTSGVVGAPFYGFKLAQKYSEGENIIAYSSRVARHAPYFKMTYRVNQPYVLDYAPAKYNNCGSIYNFQRRMNCYAYALQVYNKTYDNQSVYKLLPGEIGIGTSNSIFSTRNELVNQYVHYESTIENCVKEICMNYVPAKNPYSIRGEILSNKTFLDNMCNYSDFVESQMNCDAEQMNFTINKINTSNGFVLPSNFNENSERVIAMITYYIPDIANDDGIYFGTLDYHFYLRHGNGTCPNGHGGTCSMWSHKPGTGKIANVSCDANIHTNAPKDFTNINDVRYYRITKDTSIYSSWHGDSTDTNGGATPYCP